jgi:5'-nucleotidase
VYFFVYNFVLDPLEYLTLKHYSDFPMKNKRPKILVTNDDGIHAPGIHHLWVALSKIADVVVAAPTVEQSATGLAITIRSPLRLERLDWGEGSEVWSVNGTPADCVKMGLNVLLKSPPDLIVSGINRGNNAGRNLLYSGTVAAVIEGVLHDIPGVAFSCYEYDSPDYSVAEQYVPIIIHHVLDHPLPLDTFLNVNIPTKNGQKVKGFRFARQGKAYWAENPDIRSHPFENHSYYWLGARLAQFEEHEDSDIALLEKGYLTAVPIRISEMTHHQLFEDRREHFDTLFPVTQ